MDDKVFLKIKPLKAIARSKIKGKLTPHFVRPFGILGRVGECSYRLDLPPDYSYMHNVFHVSLQWKYISDSSHIIQIEPLEIHRDLTNEEHPQKILDTHEKQLHKKIVSLVNVLWRHHGLEEVNWELRDEFLCRYPSLFA